MSSTQVSRRSIGRLTAVVALLGWILLGPARFGHASEPQPQTTLTAAALASAELFGLAPEEWADPPEAVRPAPPQPYPLVVRYGSNVVRVGNDGRLQGVNLRSTTAASSGRPSV